jgi:hypothetical protein
MTQERADSGRSAGVWFWTIWHQIRYQSGQMHVAVNHLSIGKKHPIHLVGGGDALCPEATHE